MLSAQAAPRLRRFWQYFVALIFLIVLSSTVHAVLARPPHDAPWTVPNVKINPTSAGNNPAVAYAPYAAVAAFSSGNLVAAWTDLTPAGFGNVIAARSTTGGASWSAPVTVSVGTVSLPSTASPAIALAVTGTQTVHAGWIQSGASDYVLYYNRSTDGGLTWAASPTALATGVGPAYNPDLATSGPNVYSVWKTLGAIWLARSTNGGSTWSTPTAIYTTSVDTLWPDLSLVADLTSTLHLMWDQSTASSGQDVCYSRSSDTGLTWSARNCLVNLPTSSTHTDPDLAVDSGTGWLHLVYLDEVTRIPVLMHRRSSDGGNTWSAPVTVSDPIYSATEPNLIISTTHKLYVGWTDQFHGFPADTDIYFARSLDDGQTWGTPSRVNDLSTQPQLHPFLAAGNNGPRAVWSDFRTGTQWDIYSAAITGTCQSPLTGVDLDGPFDVEPGVATWFTATLQPADADSPISYNWSPAPGAGQGVASARYTWPVPGSYPITVTASNCGGLVSTSRTIVVMCTAPLLLVDIIGGAAPVMAGEAVTLTALTDPPMPNPTITYVWTPAPIGGQGTAQAIYRWQAVGTYPVTVTATNCGGTVMGTANLIVADTIAPAWGAFTPAGWITTTQSPTLTVKVNDVQSGLDVSTAQYQFTANAGVTWTAWTAASAISGVDYTTATQTITASNVAFGRDSTLAGAQTRIRFRTADMAGNLGLSPQYTVTIDSLPPSVAGMTISSNRATSTWINPLTNPLTWTANMTWTAASDASSGVAGYAYLWSVNATDLPPAVVSTTALTATTLFPGYGQHWYFHVRAVDNVGHWSTTAAHQGPYWVGSAPAAFLTLDPESAGPGAEVVLTGFGFDPQVTVGLGFTSTTGIHWLGDVQTSIDGVFQANVTVPETATVTISGTVSTTHGFIAQTKPSGKQGHAKFSVTRGMEILPLNSPVKPGGWLMMKANYANKFGALVLEMDGGAYSGPFPMGGVTTRQASLQVPLGTYSGTHTLTVTNRVDGYIVQRNTAQFNVIVPVPPTPLTATLPTINLWPNHGIRGTTVEVTGVAPTACRLFDYNGTTLLDCKDIDLYLDLQLTTTPLSLTLTGWNAGTMIYQHPVEMNPYTGQYTGTLKLLDEFSDTTFNEPWGIYNLCLFAKQKIASTTDPGGQPGGLPGGSQTWTTYQLRGVACQTFTVEEPPKYVEDIRLADKFDQRIAQIKSPQIVFRGTNTGYLTGTHPVKIHQSIVQTDGLSGNIKLNVAEGNYWIDAFACDYLPRPNIPVQNNGRGGYYPTRTITLTSANGLGPSPRGVSTNLDTALASSGKIGPFLSFQGALYKPSAPPIVPLTIWFNNQLESISAVTVSLPSGATLAATHQGTDPNDATRDLWTANLDVTNFPAGQVTTTVTAFGHYVDLTGACPPGDRLGAPWPVPIVMVPAPGWLKKPLANPSVSYDPVQKMYFMSGRVGQGVPGKTDWTVIPAGVNLNYLGLIENKITVQVDVAEEFSLATGVWKATLTKISGESGILCFPEGSGLPGATNCKQAYPKDSSQLVASPSGGEVKSAADASMPSSYTWNGQLSSKAYGPWTVYNGVIASYWGIVNVNLSISFGASSQATMVATLLSDLNPNPIHIEPSATLNGNISLWVDILLGVASAGVSGQPYLTVGFPVDIISDTVKQSSTTVCFGLNGEVWASMLWWEASFGPFEIFKTGACPALATSQNRLATTPPPSILPAPSLAADGYGHLLGTWIHNSSNTPGQNVGVMYYVYWDGASWSDGAPGIADPAFLISDPEVAFAGPGQAVAVFATNSLSTTKPVTWSQVTGQVANQEIAYSVFDGQTWSAPTYLTNAVGPSGRVTLAGDPLHGQAMAAWVHDTTEVVHYKQWLIEYAVYNAQAGTWTPSGANRVAALPSYGSVNAEPSLAFNAIGEAALIFVNQRVPDPTNLITSTTPFNDNSQRVTALYKWSPATQGWLSLMLNIPKGALMPSVAFDQTDRPIVAYSLYNKDQGGGPTGIGNNNLLGYAILSGTQWITQTHGTVHGVERPRIIPLKSNLAVILFRGFGAVNTPEFGGVPMAVTVNPLKPNQPLSKAGKLTTVAGWMYAGTQTGSPGQPGSLVTLGVHNLSNTPPAAALSTASLVPAMSAAGQRPFSGAADDVAVMNIPVQPDLSITAADIEVGDTVPVSGTAVPLTVTVRNLGLAATTQAAELKVFQDEGTADQQLVWSGQTPPELMFMDTCTFTVNWLAVSGVHQLTAQVYPALAEDLDGENNQASYAVGSPAAPTGLTVSTSAKGPVAGLAWTISAGSAISGYLVYRGVGTDTLYYLGYSSLPAYLDQAVAAGGRYRYAVSAITDAGVESAPSAEVIALMPGKVYLPIVFKQTARQ